MRLKVTAVAVMAAVTVALGGAATAATRSVPIDKQSLWSGYSTYIDMNAGVGTSTDYYADARWTVPELVCDPTHQPILGLSSSVAMWVGLGGVPLAHDAASGNLVQAGILSRCGAYRQYDNAVYQILPPDSTAIYLDATKYPVKPGDSIDVTVEQRSTYVYSMEINDYASERWTWSQAFTVSFSNVPDSADYIVEKPGPYQADFGTVTFHESNYDTFPLGSCPTCGPSFLNEGYALQFLTVNNLGQPLTTVGPLSNPLSTDPGTFSVTWKAGS